MFDEDGLWDKNEKHLRMRSAIEGGALVGRDAYMLDLYKAEHLDPFRWTPTPQMMVRLKHAIRTKKQHS